MPMCSYCPRITVSVTLNFIFEFLVSTKNKIQGNHQVRNTSHILNTYINQCILKKEQKHTDINQQRT